jgi:hypothetical protein
MASVARGRDARSRLLVVLAVVSVLVSLLVAGAADPRPVLGAPGSNTTTFGVVITGSVTAGSAFTVTVTAKDSRGRTVNAYPGGATLSGLASSPSGAAPTYGALTAWTQGVASTTVIATKSQTGAKLTASDTIDGVAVSGQSAAFSVAPSSAASIAFSSVANGFDGQPVDTKFDTPIASSLASSFVPVKVIALDTFGNRVGGVAVAMAAPAALHGTTSATTSSSGSFGASPYGEASFSNLLITPFGKYNLGASAGALAATSDQFEIVADLAKCGAASCKNTGRSVGTNLQITYSSLTGVSTLSGLTLTTSFIGDASTAGCSGSDVGSIGELSEVRVQGDGITTAQPSFQLAVILPKLTLQNLGLTSRAVDTYNICLGATRLDGGTTGWTGRETLGGPVVTLSDPDHDGVFWGWAADCGTAGVTTDSPCVTLKTKNAGQLQAELGLSKNEVKNLPFESSDLGLVIRKPYPWDAKVGVH